MFRDAVLKGLSGLSNERYQQYTELVNASKPTPGRLKAG
jgi:hypothetical protein